MKKLLALFFIVSFLCFGADPPENKNIDKSTQMKKEIELLKNQVIELSNQVMKSNNKINILKVKLEGLEKKDGENLGLTYNIDQIYNNSMGYYEKTMKDAKEIYKASLSETKLIYNEKIENIDKSIATAQWVLGIIVAVFGGLYGFFQVRNDRLLKEEKIEIKNDNEKTKQYIKNKTSELEKKLTTIIKKHDDEIQKIKEKFEEDKEIIEFNTALTRALNKHTPEERIKELNKIKNKFTENEKPRILCEIAYQYHELNQSYDAILYYKKAITLNPYYEMAFTNRGCVYAHLGLYDEAISDFDTALRLVPNNTYAYNNRAETQLLFKKYKLALSDLIEFIKIDNKNQLGIDLSQEIYDEFKKYLEEIEEKNDLEQEIYNKLLAQDGFTIIGE